MNWEAIGAIAELTGALAVFLTLVYLAVQIRQNTKALQGTTLNAITAQTGEELKWASEQTDVSRMTRQLAILITLLMFLSPPALADDAADVRATIERHYDLPPKYRTPS